MGTSSKDMEQKGAGPGGGLSQWLNPLPVISAGSLPESLYLEMLWRKLTVMCLLACSFY